MNKILAYIAIVLGVLEIVLVLASWMLSVLLPDSGIRSMLDGEGIRWFFGGFVDMLAGPVLVWILLLSIAVGCFYGSGLACVFRSGYSLRYRERIALTLVGILLLVYAGAFGLLAFIPHAVLLSASGHIFRRLSVRPLFLSLRSGSLPFRSFTALSPPVFVVWKMYTSRCSRV